MSFFLLLNTKEDILFGTIDFHCRKINTMEVNGAKVPETHTGLQQLEGE